MNKQKWTTLARKYVIEMEDLGLTFDDCKKHLEKYTTEIVGSRYYFKDRSSIDFWLADEGKGAAIVYAPDQNNVEDES